MILMATLEGLTDQEFTAAYDEAIESGDSVREFHQEARRRLKARRENNPTNHHH